MADVNRQQVQVCVIVCVLVYVEIITNNDVFVYINVVFIIEICI